MICFKFFVRAIYGLSPNRYRVIITCHVSVQEILELIFSMMHGIKKKLKRFARHLCAPV